MKHLSNFLFILSYLVYAIWPISSSAVNKEMVIAQMNSCVNTLTNIINNKSMTVLEHETDQLLNNLTIEQIIELDDIVEFRTKLIKAVGELSITEEERSLLKRVHSIKRDNLKWQVFSNALNNTMLLTGGGNIGIQAGFQALVTAARSGVEYKTAQNNMEIEELQAMWELRKSDLNNFIELRKEALEIIFKLYKKYNLKEADRLTEKTSLQFQKIISDPDAKRMVRLLNDNYDKFGHLADFYYYLGMGYIDLKNVPKAMEAFSKYEEAYKKAPIYRINEKSGLISLTKLSYLNNISNIEIENELSNVIKNLPNNTMALIQSAIVYDKVLNNPRKALSILRGVLDNNETQDKTASIIAGSLILPKLSNQALEYKDFLAAYSNQNTIDLDAALNICIATKNNIFSFLEKIISISSLCHHPYIFSKAQLNDKIIIEYPKRYLIDLFHIRMYVEEKKGNEITVYQYKLADAKNNTSVIF